uniref:hypothetical protein n=1 Tax=Methylogaea oryzae TaxID=1295382 RepID=UPI003571571C
MQTNVQVRDGDTVVLGGVYEDENSKDVDGVPFLSDIPYLARPSSERRRRTKSASFWYS